MEFPAQLTAKASWYSNTSMSDSFKPVLSRILGVAYAGLDTNRNLSHDKPHLPPYWDSFF